MSDQDEELAFQSYVSEHGAGALDPETGLEPTPYEEARNFFAAGRRSMAERVAELEAAVAQALEAAPWRESDQILAGLLAEPVAKEGSERG